MKIVCNKNNIKKKNKFRMVIMNYSSVFRVIIIHGTFTMRITTYTRLYSCTFGS